MMPMAPGVHFLELLFHLFFLVSKKATRKGLLVAKPDVAR